MAFDLSALTAFLTGNSAPSTKDGVLGIDIGASSIKIVQIQEEKRIPTLKTYGEILLGPYGAAELGRDTHLPEHKKVEALLDIMREAEVTTKTIAFSLSYSSSFTTTIEVPTLDQAQIGTMIPVEARKYVPIPLTKVALDWFPIGPDTERGVTRVFISAIYTVAAARYEALIKSANLSIYANELEIFSTVRSLLSSANETVAILDIGATSTRMYLITNGIVRKTHSVLMSGVELTHALEKEMQINFTRAEEIKRSAGLLGVGDEPRVQKALAAGLERGLRELHMVMKQYERDEKVTVSHITVSGGGALLQGLIPYVQDVFGTKVALADPFSKVAYPAYLEETLKRTGPLYTVAIGAALAAFQKVN
jgi:type IV pilus assembly protein PilM